MDGTIFPETYTREPSQRKSAKTRSIRRASAFVDRKPHGSHGSANPSWLQSCAVEHS
jgi:hypothetical protein